MMILVSLHLLSVSPPPPSVFGEPWGGRDGDTTLMGNGPFSQITATGKGEMPQLCHGRFRLGIREDFLLERIVQPFNSINLQLHRFSKVNQFQFWVEDTNPGISGERNPMYRWFAMMSDLGEDTLSSTRNSLQFALASPGNLAFRKAREIWISGSREVAQRTKVIILTLIITITTTSGKLVWLWMPRGASMALRGVRKQNIL